MLSKQNIIVAGLGGIIITVGILLNGSLHNNNPSPQKNIAAVKYSEKFVGFPASTRTNIDYIAKTSASSQILEIKTPDEYLIEQENTEKKANNYLASYLIQNTIEKTNIDVQITINKASKAIIAKLSGLPIGSNISLNIGKVKHVSKIPVDWAGRIDINLENISRLENENVCFTFNNLIKNKTSIMCHHVNGSSVGQVIS